jgi:DNA-binding transcriptional ArsR family regulator
MLQCGELNISEITRRSGLSHTSAVQHLEFLTRTGILSEKRSNRIRIFRTEHTNSLVGVLSRLFSEWRAPEESSLCGREGQEMANLSTSLVTKAA